MKMNQIIFATSILISTQAFAVFEAFNMLKISDVKNANYICSKAGGAMAISINDKMAWSLDSVTDTKGIEFKINNLKSYRQPHAHAFELEISLNKNGEVVDTSKMQAVMGSGLARKSPIKLIVTSQDEKTEMTCTIVPIKAEEKNKEESTFDSTLVDS